MPLTIHIDVLSHGVAGTYSGHRSCSASRSAGPPRHPVARRGRPPLKELVGGMARATDVSSLVGFERHTATGMDI